MSVHFQHIGEQILRTLVNAFACILSAPLFLSPSSLFVFHQALYSSYDHQKATRSPTPPRFHMNTEHASGGGKRENLPVLPNGAHWQSENMSRTIIWLGNKRDSFNWKWRMGGVKNVENWQFCTLSYQQTRHVTFLLNAHSQLIHSSFFLPSLRAPSSPISLAPSLSFTQTLR